ncbi:MAG: adenylate/guanylate cyclase domain-containing protein [Alphaproteobacteria bacterium]
MVHSPVTCSACGAVSAAEGRYCPHCGASRSIACNHCGQSNARSRKRCSNCGNQLLLRPQHDVISPSPASGRSLERRQLTIMFTDLVNSTGLADSMDPEDFQVLIEAHRTIAVAPITRFGGVVARYLGDGMLVLFGYPEAHEDDAERAVRAGLEVVRVTAEMNLRWVGEGRGRIAVRIGVHTGIVVVGDVLKVDVKEAMAVFGSVPSIASRLQSLAMPNGVMLTAATKALLPPAIVCEARGSAALKGVGRPVEVFAAREVRAGQGDRRVAGRVLPFVNRERELAIVRQLWASARQGEGRHLLIEGEPGIGKSRLIRAVEERIVTQPSRWLIARTSPYATNTDFFAFSELFRQLFPLAQAAGAEPGDSFDHLRKRFAGQGMPSPEIAIGLANLLGIDIPDDGAPTPLQPERTRELTLAAITAWLQHESRNQPLVLVIEDLHWADASTLEAIDRLKPTLPNHPLLLICTTRTSLTGARYDRPKPTGAMSEAPWVVKKSRPSAATQASPACAAGTVVYLERLRPASAQDLLGHVLGGAELPKAAVTTLLQRANGVPLYLEELPKPVLEADGQAGSAPIVLPASLRDSLMAQLDRMGEAKAVAQTAAVLGHSFERPLLEHVWEGDAKTLQAGLDTLTDAALIRPENDTYGFRHALLAEIAYDSLLRDERRRIHKRTADILVNHFQRIAETRPDILARHHESAGSHGDAFGCWMKAGEIAARRSANTEAIAYFRHAEAELEKLKAAGAQHLEAWWLLLHRARAPVLIALSGWSAPEVEKTYRAILRLSSSDDAGHRAQFEAWIGLSNFFLLLGNLDQANAACDRMQVIASELGDRELRLSWHRVQGLCDLLTSNFENAQDHEEEAIALIEPALLSSHTARTGTNPAVIAYSVKAWAHGLMGESTKAELASQAALSYAEEAKHPFSYCYALCLAASLAEALGNVSKASAMSHQALMLSREHTFPYWEAWASIVNGWACSVSGQTEQGIARLKNGFRQYELTGARQMRGYASHLLADAYRHADHLEASVDMASDALAEMEQTGIIFYRAAACRVLGDSLGRLHNGREAMRWLVTGARYAKRCKAQGQYIDALCATIEHSRDRRLQAVVSKRLRCTLDQLLENDGKSSFYVIQEQRAYEALQYI